MESKIGLVIQLTGIFLITALSLFLRRSLKTTASSLWLAAWIGLLAALLSLSFAFNAASPFFFGSYFFFEYVFGYLLILGCASLSEEYRFEPRSLFFLVPFAILATILSVGIVDFNYVFNVHAFIIAALFAGAFRALRNSKLKTFGWRVMRVALALLALEFFHSGVVFTLLLFYPDLLPPDNYLAFEPIFDLVLEILLGFGMVIVSLEQVLDQVQTVNKQLQEAHERLRQTAQIDPMTEAFNRHAFYGFLESGDVNSIAGCVGFFDIDDLKPINDQLGHAVGDKVIRHVVRVLRDLIRGDDLIYRWGGDEFFVLMAGMSEAAAHERLSQIDGRLTDVRFEGIDRPLTVRVSYGFKSFSGMTELESAVTSADEEMYRRKQARKRRRTEPALSMAISNENIIVSRGR